MKHAQPPKPLRTQSVVLIIAFPIRWLYWTDWSTEARIERASMDGTLRQTIVTTGLVWPNGLTIDFDSQKLYWVDASLHKIETANTDGTNRVLLTTNSIFHPFSITFYGGVLYWSDWSVNNILQMSTEAPDNVTTLLATQLLRDPMGVHMVTESRQPPGTTYTPSRLLDCLTYCYYIGIYEYIGMRIRRY